MNVGDRVRMTATRYKGQVGTVRRTRGHWVYVEGLQGANGIVQIADVFVKPVADTPTASDFDRGFGIGGLGRHEELPVVPSLAAIERVEATEQRATVCRKCGQSDEFDGAMFTTGGGDVCDDCFG